MKNNFYLILLLLLATVLVGCWDYSEVEMINFVSGTGVDQMESEFNLVTEIIKSTGVGQTSEFESVVLSTKGKSLSDTGWALSNPAGMNLFWSHARVFLVSEEVAKRGVIPAIEYVIRGRDLRSTVYFFVVKGATVEEVFKSKPPFADSVSQHLSNIVDLHAADPIFFPEEMWRFNKDMLRIGASGALPTIQLVNEGGKEVPIVKGTALFKHDRMVGWINGEESQIFTLLKGLKHRGRFIMATEIKGENYPLTYEVVSNQVKIEPKADQGRVSMAIELGMRINIAEVGDAHINFEDEGIVKLIEGQLAQAINRRTQELLQKIHGEYQTDILGFGLLLRRKEPKIWREVEQDWEYILKDLEVDVVVDVKIVLTGVLVKSIITRY